MAYYIDIKVDKVGHAPALIFYGTLEFWKKNLEPFEKKGNRNFSYKNVWLALLFLKFPPFLGLKFSCWRKKSSLFFVSYTKSFLDIGREYPQFLNSSALKGQVSNKPVSYKCLFFPFLRLVKQLDRSAKSKPCWVGRLPGVHDTTRPPSKPWPNIY